MSTLPGSSEGPADPGQSGDEGLSACRPGGYAIVVKFGPEGPKECSGLPVARYNADGLHDEFGSSFHLVHSSTSVHTALWGASQQFAYCFCRLEH